MSMVKYVVLKEFVFGGEGLVKEGDILEINQSVTGLINKGFLEIYKEPTKTEAPTAKPLPTPEVEDMEVLRELESFKDSKEVMMSYTPPAKLKKAQAKVKTKIAEAAESTKPKRELERKDLDLEMSSLMEEFKASAKPKPRKGKGSP